MKPLFVDTSFILALENADDQYHSHAQKWWRLFVRRPQPLLTTSYVFDETITLIQRRLGHDHARAVAKKYASVLP